MVAVFYNLSAQENLNISKDGVVIKGYDVVAYFSDKAVEGKDEFQTKYESGIYKFSTADNLATFQKNPKNYIPEYGGYCAWAIADSGKMVDVDPESFQILDGKLYLFYDSIFAHTLKKWQNNNPEKLKKIADKKWQNMR